MRLISALCALLLLGLGGPAARAQDVIPPEQAFPYELSASGDAITVHFHLPKGYYLYQQRFAFESGTETVSLGEPAFPEGEKHEDEFFGAQTVFRRDFDIRIPYQGQAASAELIMDLQGCADIGLCYPPQHWSRSVDLPAASGAALSRLVSGADDKSDFLPADEAFIPSARVPAANQLLVEWEIKPGYYLYRDKFNIAIADGRIQLGAPQWPATEQASDEYFGDVEVYRGRIAVPVRFSRAGPDAQDVTLDLQYQGCAEGGICYPPIERKLALTIPASASLPPGPAMGAATTATPATAAGPVSEQDRLAGVIVASPLPAVLATFFGLGVLLAFTPCVLPMVPIISGIIAGAGQNVSTLRAFSLSLSYVLGMAVAYTAAGAVAALAGAQVQALFQQTWIIVLFSGLFLLLALAMFGFFELQLPAALQTRVAGVSARQRAGSLSGTAAMGALSALIVSACVAPPLVATLAVIGQSGDVFRGAAALFFLSLGMGAPLLLVGTSAGRLLPRAGPWMQSVRNVFGIMMLAVAVWMASRVLPGGVTLALWAALALITGVFLGAFDAFTETTGPGRRLARGVGLLACAYGVILLLGAVTGGHDPLRPLAQISWGGSGDSGSAGSEISFQPVNSVGQLDAALSAAQAAGRPAMLDFTADWCVSCKEMEAYTFPRPQVQAALKNAVLLRADVSDNTADDQALLARFGIYGPPTIAFFGPDGRERKNYRLVGYVPADEFSVHAREAFGAP